MKLTRTIFAMSMLSALFAFPFPAAAETVVKYTGDARSMVDLCNASGGTGWMNDWGGHCMGKDGKTSTDCKGEPHGTDNCTVITITKVNVQPRSVGPIKQLPMTTMAN
jgi:hypothetical protein